MAAVGRRDDDRGLGRGGRHAGQDHRRATGPAGVQVRQAQLAGSVAHHPRREALVGLRDRRSAARGEQRHAPGGRRRIDHERCATAQVGGSLAGQGAQGADHDRDGSRRDALGDRPGPVVRSGQHRGHDRLEGVVGGQVLTGRRVGDPGGSDGRQRQAQLGDPGQRVLRGALEVRVVEGHGAGQRLPREPEGGPAELAGGTLLRLSLGQALEPDAQVGQRGRVAGQDVPGGAVDDGDGDLLLRADPGKDRGQARSARPGDRHHGRARGLVPGQGGGDGRVGHGPRVPGGVGAHDGRDAGGIGGHLDGHEAVTPTGGRHHGGQQPRTVAGGARGRGGRGRPQALSVQRRQADQVRQQVAHQREGTRRRDRADRLIGAGGQQVREPVGEQPEAAHGRGLRPVVEVGHDRVDPCGQLGATHQGGGQRARPGRVDPREQQRGAVRSGAEPGGHAAGQG